MRAAQPVLDLLEPVGLPQELVQVLRGILYQLQHLVWPGELSMAQVHVRGLQVYLTHHALVHVGLQATDIYT